jgi:predicted RNA-binding protein YlxR (DUF448 family)
VTADKRSLIRFVRTADGKVWCDPTGKQAGRGAYLCDESRCFERARKSHLLDRALRVRLDEADYTRLETDYVALRAAELAAHGFDVEQSDSQSDVWAVFRGAQGDMV